MENAQREVMSVLLRRLFELGLISRSVYSGAADLVHSMLDLPEFFGHPVSLTKEAGRYECAQDTQ